MNNEHINQSKEILNPKRDSVFGATSINAAKIEKEDTFELRESGKKAIYEAFGKDFPLDDFKKIYSEEEIYNDARYVLRRKNEYGKQKFRSKNLENVITAGINKFNWFSIIGSDGNPRMNAHAYETYKYDDFNNRNDTFAVLITPEKYRAENSDRKLVFGIDITYNVPEFQSKLDRTTNDPRLAPKLPRGYSRLKYFNDKKEIGDRIVPRFIAATDYFDSSNLLKCDRLDLPIQVMCFKLLDEFWTQASMLNPGNQTPNELTLTNYLESRLARSINALLKTNNKPSFDITKKKVMSAETYAEKCLILEKFYGGADETFGQFMKELHKRQDQNLWKNASKAS